MSRQLQAQFWVKHPNSPKSSFNMSFQVVGFLARMSVIQYVVVALLSTVLAVYVKARYFSPIRNVSGPFLAYFGTSWQLWHVLKGDYATAVEQVHQKYGKTTDASLYNRLTSSHQEPLRASVTTKSPSIIPMQFKPFSAPLLKRANFTESLIFPIPTMSTSCPKSITDATRKRGPM